MHQGQKAIVWFDEVTRQDVPLVGGKGANLGEMTNARIPVPPGFIVTAAAYFDFIQSSKLTDKIRNLLDSLDTSDSKRLQEVAAEPRPFVVLPLRGDGPVEDALHEKLAALRKRIVDEPHEGEELAEAEKEGDREEQPVAPSGKDSISVHRPSRAPQISRLRISLFNVMFAATQTMTNSTEIAFP